MKNKTIKIILIFVMAIILFGINKTVQANSISKIEMDIYVDNNGDAQITENWTCYANEGTEVYHPYYNLGKSQITNLSVSEGTKKYTTLNSWDTSGSLSSKANKCGINEISNGLELCWGISNYGSHTYTVKYNISKFVSELTDAQMIYWTLIPYDFSNSVGDVKIKIHSDEYIQDAIEVWGYGNYGGLAYVSNGAIYMDSDGSLSQNEYMTILVKFPIGTFNTTNNLNKDFDYYFKMAQEGSKKYNEEGGIKGLSTILPIILFIIIGVGTQILALATYKNTDYRYGIEKKKIPKDLEYYRDIPCNGDIFRAYYIGYIYGIVKNKTDLLGAIILKWIKEGKVKTDKIEKGGLSKKEETVIILTGEETVLFEDSKEQQLYNMLYTASGDGILEKREFEKWCSGKYTKVLNWFDSILRDERNKLIKEGLILEKEVKIMKTFKTKEYEYRAEVTEQAIKLAGLKKYLLEYTLIKDREAIEVELFENYLVYAQLMGIAKEVSKEFKDLYSEIIEESHYNSYDDILFIHYCSKSGISSANSARQAAESYSSGGGGFSSGGGGGGSFGGGGGGRRLSLETQFTLYANCERGNRPSFTEAAKPEIANELYEYIITKCKQELPNNVQTGIFGANMQIDLSNDGPVTIVLEKI